ncbi:uncharacterized protein LOC144283277 isoform X1 [Canis aureus]
MALRWKYLIKSDYKALGKMKCQLHKWQAIIKVISGSGKQGYLLSQLQDNGSHWNKRPSLCQLFLAHVLWNLKTCIPRDADICNMPLLFPLLGSAVDQLWATGRRQAGILLPHVYLSESCKKSHSTPRMDQLKETSLLWPVDSLFTFMCLLTLMKSAAMS